MDFATATDRLRARLCELCAKTADVSGTEMQELYAIFNAWADLHPHLQRLPVLTTKTASRDSQEMALLRVALRKVQDKERENAWKTIRAGVLRPMTCRTPPQL